MNHSAQICQKITCAFCAILAITFGACNQSIDLIIASPEETHVSLKHASIVTADYICNPQSASLIAGQSTLAGIVNLSVNPNNGNILVSVSTQDGWAFKSIQLFVSDKTNTPINNGGNPRIGNLAFNENFGGYRTSFSYELVTGTNNITQAPDGRSCIIISIHANVDKLNSNGHVLQSESAWMDGTRIIKKENWAAYYIYYLMPCGAPQP